MARFIIAAHQRRRSRHSVSSFYHCQHNRQHYNARCGRNSPKAYEYEIFERINVESIIGMSNFN